MVTFILETGGQGVRLRATPEVMTGDGFEVERDPPAGWVAPLARRWKGPDGKHSAESEPRVDPNGGGRWQVSVPVSGEVMTRVDIEAEAVGI